MILFHWISIHFVDISKMISVLRARIPFISMNYGKYSTTFGKVMGYFYRYNLDIIITSDYAKNVFT